MYRICENVVSQGYYQTNNEVLKFDINKDLDKIRFNHYISAKENIQRIKGDLPRGQFYMAISTVAEDLNIKEGKARGLIEKFRKLKIITNVYTPPRGCKNPSIWRYNSVTVANNDDSVDIRNEHDNDNHSKINASQGFDNSDISNDAHNQISKSKKENMNNKTKRDIYSSLEHEQQVQVLWALYPVKVGKGKVINKIIKLIDKYGFQQIERCIDRYKQSVTKQRSAGFKDLKFQNGGTFFNSGYIDYLDENYSNPNNENSRARTKEQENIPEDIKDWG